MRWTSKGHIRPLPFRALYRAGETVWNGIKYCHMDNLTVDSWPVPLPVRESRRPHDWLVVSAADRAQGLWISEIGYHRYIEPAGFDIKRHDEWHLVLAAAGEAELIQNGRPRRWLPGRVLLVPQSMVHTYGCRRPWAAAFLSFGGPRAGLLAGHIANGRAAFMLLRRPAQAWETFREMFRICRDRRTHVQELLSARLLDLLVWICDDWTAGHRNDRTSPAAGLVTTMQEWLASHISQPLSLSQMAAVAGFSPSHFGALWKAQTGHAPIDYLIELRMLKAKEMLSATKVTIGDIAAATGFTDQLYFSRRFHKCAGLSPTEYRRRFSL